MKMANHERLIELMDASGLRVFGIRYQSTRVVAGDTLANSVHPAEWLREIGIEAEHDQELDGTCAYELKPREMGYDFERAIKAAQRLRGEFGKGQIILIGGTGYGTEIPEADDYGICIRNAQILAIVEE